MTRFRLLTIFLSLALVLMACQLTQQFGKQTAEPTSVITASPEKDTPTDKALKTEPPDPTETQVPENNNPDLAARPKPPQSQAAEIRPNEMRTKLTQLNWLSGAGR
jgi:hypothetical protein